MYLSASAYGPIEENKTQKQALPPFSFHSRFTLTTCVLITTYDPQYHINMKLTIAFYLTSFVLTTSAGKGMIGYNELYGRADACFQTTTGASDTPILFHIMSKVGNSLGISVALLYSKKSSTATSQQCVSLDSNSMFFELVLPARGHFPANSSFNLF